MQGRRRRFGVLTFCAEIFRFAHKNTTRRRHRHVSSSGLFEEGFNVALPPRVFFTLYETSVRWDCSIAEAKIYLRARPMCVPLDWPWLSGISVEIDQDRISSLRPKSFPVRPIVSG